MLRFTKAGESGPIRELLRWFARCVVALVVVATVVCAIGYTFGAEHFWLLAQVQYLPYPIYLVPTLATIAISFLLGRAWRMASLLGFALVATTVMGLEFHTGDAGTDRIRMMTYNIKGYLALGHPAGMALIAREIALHDPDILVLQDAKELTEAEERSPGASRAIFGELRAHSYGQYVVASRYPVRDCKYREIPFLKQSQGYVQCIVEARGIEVDVITAHFMTPRYALGAAREGQIRAAEEWRQNFAERMSQAEALAQDVRASRRPVILAGDLNAPESSIVLRTLLATGVRNAFSTAGKGYGYTWGHSIRPGISFLRIDHVLVSPEIGVAGCFVGGDQGSPHRPVIADLYLNRRPG
jgi:endonuclease/exonuclease/phosphatase (EEP) superfamily protein YafD